MRIRVTPRQFRTMRKALGLTQERIARLFGYPDAQMIGRYERAETTIPGPTKALMYLMHDEQVNGNKHAVRDYMVRALTSQHHGNKGE